MIRVFADSFYYFALLNARDHCHQRAVDFSQRTDVRYVTTAWVMTEVADGLSTVGARLQFMRLFEAISARPDMTELITPSQALFDAGVRLYGERPDKQWSLTDCISFAVMETQQISDALTGDRHFEQAGYRAILSEP